MKKLILKLLRKFYDQIVSTWESKLVADYGSKLSGVQIQTFVESSVNSLIDIIEQSDYQIADQYLIDTHNLFSKADLNLLEISQIFHAGRNALMNNLQNNSENEFDPVILLGFLDELVEHIYARYVMLHKNVELKEMESDRNRLANKLELNQKYLSSILHTSESAIVVIDDSEKFQSWNKGAENIFGYKEAEVIGQPSSLLLPKEDKYFSELESIIDSAKSSSDVRILDTERRTKDGRILPVQLSVARLHTDNGEYTGRTVIIRDQSHIKNLQLQIDQSEKLAVIGQLAAGVAHEIGNPLASISSLVQLMQRKNDNDVLKDQLLLIKENIDRISKIVRELVDFSRPPSYEKVFIQITDVVKTAVGIVKYDKRVKKVNFETELDPDIPLVRIVPDQILQVFVNILINALDAIEGKGTIRVKSHHDDNNIFVEIEDNGCGMDKETLDKIFNPFFTTKEVGKGTGLGLSVSYSIVKKFNGEINAESILNKGSKFVIKLPVLEN